MKNVLICRYGINYLFEVTEEEFKILNDFRENECKKNTINKEGVEWGYEKGVKNIQLIRKLFKEKREKCVIYHTFKEQYNNY